jgi:hypothetical protein
MHPRPIPEHLTLGLLEWIRVGMLAVVCGVIAFLWVEIRHVDQDLIKNRHVTCDLQTQLGQPQASDCK